MINEDDFEIKKWVQLYFTIDGRKNIRANQDCLTQCYGGSLRENNLDISLKWVTRKENGNL